MAHHGLSYSLFWVFFSLSLFCFVSMNQCIYVSAMVFFCLFFSQSVMVGPSPHIHTHTVDNAFVCFVLFSQSVLVLVGGPYIHTYTHDDEPNPNQNPHQTFPTTTKNTVHKHCTYIYILTNKNNRGSQPLKERECVSFFTTGRRRLRLRPPSLFRKRDKKSDAMNTTTTWTRTRTATRNNAKQQYTVIATRREGQ